MILKDSRFISAALCAAAAFGVGGCGGDSRDPNDPVLPDTPFTLSVQGNGAVNDRFTAELWVSGSYAYTTTWGTRTNGS
jgi:hypothetical protein